MHNIAEKIRIGSVMQGGGGTVMLANGTGQQHDEEVQMVHSRVIWLSCVL